MSMRYGRRSGQGSVFWAKKRYNRPNYSIGDRAARTTYTRFRASSSATRGRVRALKYQALNLRTGGLLGIEKKFLDCSFAQTLVSPADSTGGEVPPASGATGCYTAPAQGDNATARDGNRIMVTEINAQGVCQVNAQINQTAADIACHVFVALVQDQQTNGVQLNSEDVFSNPAGLGTASSNPFRNMSYIRRFKVLRVKKFTLRPPPLTWDGTNIEQSGYHIPFQLRWAGKMPVTFTTASTTADIANVTDNSIQMVAFCSQASTLAPTIYGNVRTRFYG